MESDIEKKTQAEDLRILSKIAESFAEDSEEYQVVKRAALALMFVEANKVAERFKKFSDSQKKELSDIEINYLKTILGEDVGTGSRASGDVSGHLGTHENAGG